VGKTPENPLVFGFHSGADEWKNAAIQVPRNPAISRSLLQARRTGPATESVEVTRDIINQALFYSISRILLEMSLT
jgi:hypothetical protein